MTDKWWDQEHEDRTDAGETYSYRTRTAGVVWDEHKTHDDQGRRRYRAWVRIAQHDHEDVPQVSLWMHNGNTPPPVLTVEDCRTLGYALLDAAELVDRERDRAIRELVDGGRL